MDVKISIDSQLRQMEEALKKVDSRDLPYVTRIAINETAKRTMGKIKRDLPSFIDRPVPFTVNSLFIRYASRTKLEASIEWRDWGGKSIGAGRPLDIQSTGGDRPLKGFERALQAAGLMPRGMYAIPTKDAPRDAYGNVPGRFYVQMLSYLRADRSGTQNAPRGALNTRQKRARKRAKVKAFVVSYGRVMGTQQRTKLPDGIYQRIDSALGNAFRQIFFFDKRVTYQKRIPLKETTETYVRDTITGEFEKAVEAAVKARASFKD